MAAPPHHEWTRTHLAVRSQSVPTPDFLVGKRDDILTEYHYVWYNYVKGSYEIRIQKMAKFTITPEGEIIPGDGFEDNHEAEYIANKKAKAAHKVGPGNRKAENDIIGLRAFEKLIPDEAAAIAFLEERIWGGTPWCPKCGSLNTYRPKSGKPLPHRCRDCRKYFSVRVGTPMEKSLLDTRTWLLAIHIMHTSRKGTSALQLSKMLDVCYKTAWFLCHRIREGMNTGDVVMAGVVEVDEAYIGGKEGSKHANKKLHKDWMDGKMPVMGFWCGGKVIIFPIKHIDKKTVEKAVLGTVPHGSGNTIHSDASPVYGDMEKFGYDHEFVNHSAGEFVRDMVTTNGIESFWALLKRGYIGTFHIMSEKHLFRYCREFAFRHNSGPGNGLETIGETVRKMPGNRLRWIDLTAGPRGEAGPPA
jgi:transposase-like protein